MTMHRRPLGRPRLLASVAAVVTLGGCLLPWWTVGGRPGELTLLTGNAFDSTGILAFAAAIATLALVTLPYASVRPVSADRWESYALIASLGWFGFLYRLLDLGLSHAFLYESPAEVVTRNPGLWVAGIGLVMLARATYEMRTEPRIR